MGHWLQHWLGMDDLSSPVYGFLSGSGSIIIPWFITTLPIVAVLLRKHNCHVHRCLRLGRHPVEGTVYVVCRRHHPDDRLTHAHVVRSHLAALRRRDGGHNGAGT